jgi:hypothetical protein
LLPGVFIGLLTINLSQNSEMNEDSSQWLTQAGAGFHWSFPVIATWVVSDSSPISPVSSEKPAFHRFRQFNAGSIK